MVNRYNIPGVSIGGVRMGWDWERGLVCMRFIIRCKTIHSMISQKRFLKQVAEWWMNWDVSVDLDMSYSPNS